MNFYDANRAWSDRFLPHIKDAVGKHLLDTSPEPLDWHEATDLMMLDARDLRIAARVGTATQPSSPMTSPYAPGCPQGPRQSLPRW